MDNARITKQLSCTLVCASRRVYLCTRCIVVVFSILFIYAIVYVCVVVFFVC